MKLKVKTPKFFIVPFPTKVFFPWAIIKAQPSRLSKSGSTSCGLHSHRSCDPNSEHLFLPLCLIHLVSRSIPNCVVCQSAIVHIYYASPFGFLHSTLTSRRSLCHCDDEKTFETFILGRGTCFKSGGFLKFGFGFDSDFFTIMAYCLPSNLENFIPPPFEQRSQPPPWRGSFVVRGVSSDRTITQKIFVTAVETDGEKYVDACPKEYKLIPSHPSRASHWPETFYVRVVHGRPVLRDIQAWVKECVPPLPICTFMPNRLRDQNANAVNQTNFRSLSRILFENQAVCLLKPIYCAEFSKMY